MTPKSNSKIQSTSQIAQPPLSVSSYVMQKKQILSDIIAFFFIISTAFIMQMDISSSQSHSTTISSNVSQDWPSIMLPSLFSSSSRTPPSSSFFKDSHQCSHFFQKNKIFRIIRQQKLSANMWQRLYLVYGQSSSYMSSVMHSSDSLVLNNFAIQPSGCGLVRRQEYQVFLLIF